jgi:peptidoglycan/LPS O-acetylase OafA/YrhL
MRRISELDAVRGIAAVVIVLFHWRFHLPVLSTAVDLFFVLSGYLITTILLRATGTSGAFRTFYIRRGLRIFPIYYLTFAIFLAINSLVARPHRLDALPYFLSYTQFIQGYWGQATPPFSQAFGHTWTLAIEEQFYLFWPLIVWTVGRKGLPAVCLALLATAIGLRYAGLDPHLLLTRCDGLVLGGWLASMLADGERLRRRRAAFGIAFAVVAIASLVPIGGLLGSRPASSAWLARVSVFYTCLVGLIVAYAGHPALRPLRTRWLCDLGKISYGLYMYHIPVFTLIAEFKFRYGFRQPVLFDLLKLAATGGVALLSWRYIEQPLLRLKDRIAHAPGDASRPSSDIEPRAETSHRVDAGSENARHAGPHWGRADEEAVREVRSEIGDGRG